MTIDDYIDQRNKIQLAAEALGDETGRKMWIRLGAANRIIKAVLDNNLTLVPGVVAEIENCLRRAKEPE